MDHKIDLSEVLDFPEAQQRQEKIVNLPNNRPKWIFTDDNDNVKVNASLLGYEVIEEIPMIRSGKIILGARFDKKVGAWRLGNLSDFLDYYITDKLESVNKWSQQKLNETKKFIMIKIFNSDMIDNPFDNSKPYLVNFKNGTYNMKTGEFKDHDVKDYILQSHDYSIEPNTQETPLKTIQWLRDLTGNSDSTKYLMELIGYCFYRSYEPFQTITILQGSGRNGKSTFLNLFGDILGKNNISNITLQDLGNKQNRFASSNLYQKEANIFADVDAEFLTATGLLKALTGMDSIPAEFKGQDPFMFENFAKLVFSANDLPPFNDFTVGFDRRLYVVPFTKVIDDEFKSRHDLKAIREEIPVFVVYCMSMFVEALKRGELTVSEPMQEAKDKWLKDSNHVLRFIEERCYIDKTASNGDSSKNIYEAYQKFCFQESLKELSQPKFTKQLEKMGIFKKNPRVNGNRVQRYIHLYLENTYTPSES